MAQTSCATADLAVGSAVEAALDANDCALRDAIGSGTSTAFAKRYKFTVAEDTVAAVNLTSSAFDTLLLIYTAASPSRLLASNDNAPDHPTNSRVVISLPPGEYYAIASSPRAGLSGAFKLAIDGESPRSCDPLPLNTAGATDGAFGDGSCRFLDLNAFSTNVAFVQFYLVGVAKDSVVTIKAGSAPPRFSMVVSFSATSGFRGTSQMLFSYPAGEALLSVSSPDAGAFSLETTVEDPRPCPSETIAIGSEVSSALDSTGCRTLDYIIPSPDPTPMKLYRFEVTAPTIVTIDQTSQLIDSYLLLFTQQGAVLAENNNRALGVSDSRINMHLLPGSYFAAASALDETQLGPYTLKVAGEAPRACSPADLISGQAQEGTLSTDGCRHIDVVPRSTLLSPVTPFRLNAQGRKTVGVSLRANAAGETLSLINPSGVEVYRQPVSVLDRTLTFDMTLLTGEHKVLLWSNALAAPTYNLTATVNDPRACPVADLGLNDTQAGTLLGAECRASDVVPYYPLASQVRSYRLNLPARGRLTVSMEPGAAFVPRLVAMRGTDAIIGQTAATTPATVTLAGILSAGEYFFHATTSSQPGPFTIRAAFQPDGIVSAFKASPAGDGGMEAEAGSTLERMRGAAALHEQREK